MSKRRSWFVISLLVIVVAIVVAFTKVRAFHDGGARDSATSPASSSQPTSGPAPTSYEGTPALPAGDVVFSRNLKKMRGDYEVLPQQYRLGTAYVRPPPQWWKNLAASHKFEDQAQTFPLAFVGRWTPDGGAERLVVLQMRHRFNGDGFWTPGPALWMAAYVFERTPTGEWSQLWSDDNALNMHTMQNARLLAGQWGSTPGTISMRVEQRDGQGKMNSRDVTVTVTPDGKVTFTPANNY